MSILDLELRMPLHDFELLITAQLPRSTAVLGPSGAGKSSLLEAIAGLRRVEGCIRLADRALASEHGVHLPPEQRDIGFVSQDALLFPHLDVRANLLFGATSGSRRGSRQASAPAVPEMSELAARLELSQLLERYPRHLSGGERRRVAIARAILRRPQLLLLDEPTQGLDPRLARRVVALLRELLGLGMPMVLVTHREDEAEALAETVVWIERGRVMAHGSARTVLRSPQRLRRGGAAETVLTGTVEAHRKNDGVTWVELAADHTVSASRPEAAKVVLPLAPGLLLGSTVSLAVRAEDVLVATQEPRGLSARNVISGAIEEIIQSSGGLPAPDLDSTEEEGEPTDVWVRVGPFLAHCTRAAVRDLDLTIGRQVWMVVKSHSWRIVG